MIRVLCHAGVWLALLLWPLLATASDQRMTCHAESQPVFHVLEDPSHALSAEAVLEAPDERFWTLVPGVFPVEYSHSAFWLRFSLSAADDSPCMSWLSVGEPRLNNVQVHVRRDSGWIEMHAGRDYPVDQWSTHTRQPLFPLSLDNGEQVDVGTGDV